MINEKLKKIKLVITDVDGVLTDGLLHYDANGEAIKSFHVLDGCRYSSRRIIGQRFCDSA